MHESRVSTDGCEKSAWRLVGFRTYSMRVARSRHGGRSTTKSVRTAVWDIKPRESLPRRRQQASTQLCERKETQTPSLSPRAPLSRLKPRMAQQKLVVFLRERKRGAGQVDPAYLNDIASVTRSCQWYK